MLFYVTTAAILLGGGDTHNSPPFLHSKPEAVNWVHRELWTKAESLWLLAPRRPAKHCCCNSSGPCKSHHGKLYWRQVVTGIGTGIFVVVGEPGIFVRFCGCSVCMYLFIFIEYFLYLHFRCYSLSCCPSPTHTFHPSTQEAESSRSLWVQGQDSLHSKFQASQD